MDTDLYRDLIRDWRIFLNGAPGLEDMPANARRPIRDVVSERIWRVYRRLYRNGGLVTPNTPAEGLHNLRKESKKLRYLIEILRSLYPPDEIIRLTSPLKQLQDNLGAFNDYEVHQQAIKGFADLMMAENRYSAPTFMAMGHLVERLERGQKKERARFQPCFSEFADKKNRRRFKGLFQPRIGKI
jgi:CHAD domain-containing protein